MSDKLVSPSEYYDKVAPLYNSAQTVSDWIVRDEVSRIFKQNVLHGNVLDFGGGTGLDLQWLVNAGYYVYFLEPSANMRSVARETQLSFTNYRRIEFIEEGADIYQWSPAALPFPEKMTGILLNFAVLNSINRLTLFFKNIRMICRKESCLVISLIDSHPDRVLKKYGISHRIKHIVKGYSVIKTHFCGIIHQTFLYPISTIKKCSGEYFEFVSCHSIEYSEFMIVILVAR